VIIPRNNAADGCLWARSRRMTNASTSQRRLNRQFDTRVPNHHWGTKKMKPGRVVLQSNCQRSTKAALSLTVGRCMHSTHVHCFPFTPPESSKHPRRQRNGAQLDQVEQQTARAPMSTATKVWAFPASLALTCLALNRWYYY
jgi:hypothetical protein